MKDKKRQNTFFGWIIGISLFVILLIVLSFIKVTPTGVFTDKQHHFSLKYPEYWGVQTHPDNHPLVLAQFFPPPSSEGFRR